MKKGLFIAATLAAGASVSAGSLLTPKQTLERRAIGELEFSPDGSKLAFTVTEAVKGKSRARAIWLLDVQTGRLRQLTFSGATDGSPRWQPDGSAIGFTSDRDGGEPQLYLLPLRGGEAERLTDGKERVESFRWSPDGTRIALLMKDPKPEARVARERDRDDSHVADKDERHAGVWMLNLASRRVARVTVGGWKVDQVEWLPDGRQLIAAATDRPEIDQWVDRIYRLDVGGASQEIADAAFVQVAAPRGPFNSLSISPDGRRLPMSARASTARSPMTCIYSRPTADRP